MKTFAHIILFLCLAIHLDAADVREFRAVPVKKAIFPAYSPLDDIMFVVPWFDSIGNLCSHRV